MDTEKKYVARRYRVVTQDGAKIINDEAMFSSHELGLRYLLALASLGNADPESQMEILEFTVNSGNPWETTAEWQYDAGARLLWSPDDVQQAELAPDPKDLDLYDVGTVVRVAPWPFCKTSQVFKECIGVVEDVRDHKGEDIESDEQHGPFQYSIVYVNELGVLEHCDARGKDALEEVPATEWHDNEGLHILSHWTTGELELPEDLLEQLETGGLCARCIENYLEITEEGEE